MESSKNEMTLQQSNMYCTKHTDTPLTGRKGGLLFGTELMESMDKDDKDFFESLELFCEQCEIDLDIQRRKDFPLK